HFIDKQGGIEVALKILGINLKEEDDKSDIDNNTKRSQIEQAINQNIMGAVFITPEGE
ncbi:36567_t:CDS:2, partial [Gigaspora margarita]